MTAADAIVIDRELSIRPMRESAEDLALVVRWRNEQHVREWWDPDDPPMTVDEAVRDLGPSIRGEDADRCCLIEVDGVPIGFIQFSPWAAWPDDLREIDVAVPEGSWGLDLYIGEPGWLDRGIGTRVVRMLCDHLFVMEHATAVAFGVELANARGLRAYEKAGMSRSVEYVDTDTRDGERVRAVMMVRMAPGGTGG